jgi:hypothetical protein
MAYRKPGVTVTQEFLAAAPALAAEALPSVVVGPSYQLVDDDGLGTYAGAEQLFAYASKLGGAITDLEELSETEQFPDTKKPISVSLTNTFVEILAEQDTGAVVGDAFSDLTSSQFMDVVAGDILTIVEAPGLTILATRTDGAAAAPNANRLSAGVANPLLFANVKVGDSIVTTGGTNITVDTFAVTAKVGSNLLILGLGAVTGLNLYVGVASVTDVAYSITGSRGAENAGDYVIKTVTDDNNLVLLSPVILTPEAPMTYSIKRNVGTIVLDRVASFPGNGYMASASGITLPLGLTYDSLLVMEGDVVASYRALRIDLAAEVRNYVDVAALNSVFGADQVVPANPLAFGLSLMLQNTVTPVNGLGLDANAVVNEVLSYTAAADVLKRGEMYAIALLSQNPVVHTLYKNHVEQMSVPEQKQERVVIFNSRLVTEMVLQEEDTTVTTAVGSRAVVGTQIDGSGVYATNPKALIDLTAGQFANVKPGDSLVIVAGTGATPGTYVVASVTDDNNLLTVTNFLASGSPTDIQYYIYRKDGIAADGLSLYDRNAAFFTNGVASGHFVTILSGTYAGRFQIATVVSDKELTFSEAILGVASLVSAVNYQVDRDLFKTEQADAIKGYSRSFASRRCAHVWPDVLEVPLGQTIIKVPGYYAPPVIAALTTGLPTQQGFTNLAVSGFLGFEHSTRYFTEGELDTIADGGTMILAQDGPQQSLYVRHQLTTDRSSIKFQEYSVTKNVDFIAKFLRSTYRPFIGQYNIVDTTLDALKTTATAACKFLRDSRVPKFGGVVRTGALQSLTESTTQIDTVEMRFGFSIPIPLNHLDITIEV